MTVNKPPLSLYVHLPWCVRKCPYCDFNSYSAGDAAPRARYLDTLVSDIEREAADAGERKLLSVFLGGGTPSLFLPQEIGRVLDAVDRHFGLDSDAEISMEANPGTVECGDPAGYRSAGINRLSIGAQSFSSEALNALGRIHSVEDISRSVTEAREAGFEQINVDVMYALPGQTIEAALRDIEQALALEPQHFSWYQLTLEPNTVFHARPPAGLPDDELCADIQSAGQALLAERDFRQYEVSAYARDGSQCRHNLNYWSFGDYLAVGAGAHGKITRDDGVRRYAKPSNPLSYMQHIETGAHIGSSEPLTSRELMFEFLLNALRLVDGFGEGLFEERTGLAATDLQMRAAGALEKGLIVRENTGFWRPTSLGLRFLNDLQAEFLP